MHTWVLLILIKIGDVYYKDIFFIYFKLNFNSYMIFMIILSALRKNSV